MPFLHLSWLWANTVRIPWLLGICCPWVLLLALMHMNYQVQARWERSESLKNNCRHMSKGEVLAGGAECGRGTVYCHSNNGYPTKDSWANTSTQFKQWLKPRASVFPCSNSLAGTDNAGILNINYKISNCHGMSLIQWQKWLPQQRKACIRGFKKGLALVHAPWRRSSECTQNRNGGTDDWMLRTLRVFELESNDRLNCLHRRYSNLCCSNICCSNHRILMVIKHKVSPPSPAGDLHNTLPNVTRLALSCMSKSPVLAC